MASGVYVVTNTVTGEQYVGSSVDVHARWSHLKMELRRGYIRDGKLKRAWDRDGADAFTIDVLEHVEGDAALNAAEEKWYRQLQPAYNGTRFADRPSLHWRAS